MGGPNATRPATRPDENPHAAGTTDAALQLSENTRQKKIITDADKVVRDVLKYRREQRNIRE